MLEGLPTYDRPDLNANTDIRVRGNRSISPGGSCIHTTSGADSREWLQGGSARAGTPASSDALITREGTQEIYTTPAQFSYHAGVSTVTLDRTYNNSEVNQALIGIELECKDSQEPTWAQYDSLADLMLYYAGLWRWRWPLVYYGHYGIARPVGRRSDPVNFDWGTLAGRIYVRALATQLPGLIA